MSEEKETDRIARKDRHKGVAVHVWLSPAQLARLDAAGEITGRTRSGTIRDMIDGIKRPDRTCARAVGLLGRVGGLMKLHKIGTREEIDQIFEAIAEMREAIYAPQSDH